MACLRTTRGFHQMRAAAKSVCVFGPVLRRRTRLPNSQFARRDRASRSRFPLLGAAYAFTPMKAESLRINGTYKGELLYNHQATPAKTTG